MATANTKFKVHNGLQSNSDSTLKGNMSIDGDLLVTGDITFSTLSGASGNFFPDQDQRLLGNNTLRWNLSSFTANVGSTLDVVGAAAFSNTISVTGAVTLSNTLSVTGLSTLSSINATSSANVGSSLTVGSFANVAGAVTANGNTSFTNALLTLTTNSTSNSLTLGAANVSIDSGVLFVDSVNNRIGINNTAPAVALRVTGAADISSSANVQGSLTVAGESTLTGNVTLAGSLVNVSTNATASVVTVGGANVSVDAGVLFVDSVNNRVGINNNAPAVAFRVTGDTDISASANIQGASLLRGTVTVNGAATIANTLSTGNTTVSGFINVSSTASVGGAATLRDTLTVNGAVTVSNTISVGNTTVTGFINVLSTAQVAGAVNLNSTLTASGNTSIAGLITATTNATSSLVAFGAANVAFDTSVFFVDSVNNRVGINNTAPGVALRVTGAADISSSANVQGAANVGGTLGVVGATTLSSTLAAGNTTVTGFANVSSTLEVVGASTLRGTATVNGSLTVANTISVGNSEITGFINVSSTANVGGAATLRGTLIVNGAVTIANTLGTGNTTITGTLSSTGNTTLASSLVSITTDNVVTVGAANLVIDTNTLFVDATNNRVGVKNSAPAVSLVVTGTDAIQIPSGNTTQRPTGNTGYLRFNSETAKLELFYSGGWNEFLVGGVGNSSPVGNTIVIRDANADVYANNFYSISDAIKKENITDITDPMRVLQLCAKEYNFIGSTEKQYGLVADDVKNVIPELVSEVNGIKHVNYQAIVPLLVETVRKLKDRIDTLEGNK